MKFGMLVCDDIISDKFEVGKILTVGSGIIALSLNFDISIEPKLLSLSK